MRLSTSACCLGAILLVSCESEYTRLVKTELAKGIRNDSILLGIHFGQTRDEFYGRCFDLNKAKLVTQGPRNTVLYVFTDSALHSQPTKMRLLFYPGFDSKGVINDMEMEFSYPGWTSGNKRLQADSLMAKTKQLLMKWYKGNEFVTAHVNDSTEMPVKLDGNRRVLVSLEDPQTVFVRVQDILHPRYKHRVD